MDYTLTQLKTWDEQIQTLATQMGLDYYPQEFLLADEQDMLSFMAYSGMPSHYPHWSFGKSYDRTKTMYDYGMEGLPYELVINSNPCLAYLMQNNSELMQVLTIAHVYGHNDFFKNNTNFSKTRADDVVGRFKRHADLIRGYYTEYGADMVEPFLDAAHALQYQCNRNVNVVSSPRSNQGDQGDQGDQDSKELKLQHDDTSGVQNNENVLLYIHDHADLKEWQRNILYVVHERAQYFIPQAQTKILNEGWASFWHYTLLNELGLPAQMHLEFLVRHNQVIRPHQGGLNPYHLGFTILRDVDRRLGRSELFRIRESARDQNFLRTYLTRELVEELQLFEYQQGRNHVEVSNIGDKQGWEAVRDTLAAQVGLNSLPTLYVQETEDQDVLTLVHDHQGLDLEIGYAKKTLNHLYTLWKHPVRVKTVVQGEPAYLLFNGNIHNTVYIHKK